VIASHAALEDDQVVAVDQFGLVDIAQNLLDVR
jgi:hypothetical protein